MRPLALIAAAGALFAAVPASAQDALSLEQRYQCTAMFLIQSKVMEDGEDKDAFEGATAFMLRSAFPLGEAQGLTQDQMVDRAAAIADDLETRMIATGADDAAFDMLWTFGPTMERCLQVVLEAEA